MAPKATDCDQLAPFAASKLLALMAAGELEVPKRTAKIPEESITFLFRAFAQRRQGGDWAEAAFAVLVVPPW